ncbi:MAG: TlpA family protein disulfide reductase [Candidatus Eisenbacteria bacterium]|nr:TlpA family protein disulfide reductase [Candidatus Eisenbacteria bacterium]
MEYPHLQEIYARRGGEDFVILSVETTNRPALAEKFVAEHAATFPVLVDDQRQMRSLFGLKGVPTNLLIDRQGKIVFRHLGFAPGNEKMFEAEIDFLLAKPEGSAKGASLS